MERKEALKAARIEQRVRIVSIGPMRKLSLTQIRSSPELMKARLPYKGEIKEKLITPREVFARIDYSAETDVLTVRFDFPDTKIEGHEEHAKNVYLKFNKKNQVIQILIVSLSKDFGPSNRTKFSIEKGKDPRLQLTYQKKEDTLDVRFSSRKPTHFEVDREYTGVVRQFAGKELVGYLLPEFSVAYNNDLVIPKLGIKR